MDSVIVISRNIQSTISFNRQIFTSIQASFGNRIQFRISADSHKRIFSGIRKDVCRTISQMDFHLVASDKEKRRIFGMVQFHAIENQFHSCRFRHINQNLRIRARTAHHIKPGTSDDKNIFRDRNGFGSRVQNRNSRIAKSHQHCRIRSRIHTRRRCLGNFPRKPSTCAQRIGVGIFDIRIIAVQISRFRRRKRAKLRGRAFRQIFGRNPRKFRTAGIRFRRI